VRVSALSSTYLLKKYIQHEKENFQNSCTPLQGSGGVASFKITVAPFRDFSNFFSIVFVYERVGIS
jgi:hypothetical protein